MNMNQKLLDETTVDWADIILVMERNHRDQIIAFWPHEKNKVHLLSQYLASDQCEDDVSDPYGSSPYFYRVAISHISLGCRKHRSKRFYPIDRLPDNPGNSAAQSKIPSCEGQRQKRPSWLNLRFIYNHI